jgi:Anti-sigma-K factor rskA
MSDNSLPSPPESLPELLAGYVLGDLTPAELEIVEAYLAADPAAQGELASLMLPLDLLPLTLPANNPPASLRQQILQTAMTETAVNRAPIAKLVVESPQEQLSKLQAFQPIVAGLGLLLLAGLGWHNYRLTQELATVKDNLKTVELAQRQSASNDDRSLVSLLQQPNNRFVTLKNMPGKSGTGNLIIVPQKLVAVLILQKIPPLPPGQVYRTWAIMDDEEMNCADFLPDKDGKVFIKIPLDRFKQAKKLMVTIERKDAKAAAGEVTIEGEI